MFLLVHVLLYTLLSINNNKNEFHFFCYLQGICPGNRLKLIPAHDSGCYSPSPLSSPCPSLGAISQLSAATTPTASTPQSDFYENTGLSLMQKQGKRRSWHIMPNKVSELLMFAMNIYIDSENVYLH